MPLITEKNVKELCQQVKQGLNAPTTSISYSSLGGPNRISILGAVSLEPKEKWIHNIFENSQNFKFHLQFNGILEIISSYKMPVKLRKSTCKTVEDVIAKLNKYIAINSNNIKTENKKIQDIKQKLKEDNIKNNITFKPAGRNKIDVLRNGQRVADLVRYGDKSGDGYKIRFDIPCTLDGQFFEYFSDVRTTLESYYNKKESEPVDTKKHDD